MGLYADIQKSIAISKKRILERKKTEFQYTVCAICSSIDKAYWGGLLIIFSFTLSALLHICEIKDYKSIIVYSNPPILPITAILANRLFKTKIVFVSYDVYPEVAYASGSLKEGSAVSSVMRRINQSLFRRAKAVVALTDEMREYLLNHRPELSAECVVTISNWAHEATAGSKSAARAELGYTDEDFIVAYFGNIGICQDETALIQAMDQLADHTNIKFLISGHGNKMPSVRQAAERLPNVRICDFLTGTAFEHAVAASSCGIVSLEQGLTGMCAPSKYYSYLQGGLPILAVAEQSSYLSKDVLYSEIGLCSDVGNGVQLTQNILQLYRDPELCKKMSDNAVRLYTEKYAKGIGLNKYAALFKNVLRTAN